MLTHLSLFSGIGGLDLAAEMAGIRTVGQCEWADYPTKVLEKHWPDVPRWRDIRTLTGDSFYEKTGIRTVDIISGGFPCQPFSVAGKHGGKDDDRYLWPEMLRVIREINPTWVIGENVPGIINLALDTVLSDLESEGYEAQPFIIPACGVDAPHKRERVCILAHAVNGGGVMRRHRELQDAGTDGGKGIDNRGRTAAAITGERRQDEPATTGMADGLRTAIHEADTDTDGLRLQRSSLEPFMECSSRERERERRVQASALRTVGSHSPWEAWPDEPNVGRVADGVSNRVDRIRCLGNAVVPQQFYIFFKLIADIENAKMEVQE